MYRENTLDLDTCKFYTNSDYNFGKVKSFEIIAVANILDYYDVYSFANFDKIADVYFAQKTNNFKSAYNTVKKITKEKNIKCKVEKNFFKFFNTITEKIDAGYPMLIEYKDEKYGKQIALVTGYREQEEIKELKLVTGRDIDCEKSIPYNKKDIFKMCTIYI